MAQNVELEKYLLIGIFLLQHVDKCNDDSGAPLNYFDPNVFFFILTWLNFMKICKYSLLQKGSYEKYRNLENLPEKINISESVNQLI